MTFILKIKKQIKRRSVTCVRSLPRYASRKYSFSLTPHQVGHKMFLQIACVCSLLLPRVTLAWLCKAGLPPMPYLTSTTKR